MFLSEAAFYREHTIDIFSVENGKNVNTYNENLSLFVVLRNKKTCRPMKIINFYS